MDRLDEFNKNLIENRNNLLRYAISLNRNNIYAEDILQRSALTMWKKYDSFNATTNFVAWAMTIIKYETLNFKRSVNRCPVHFNNEMYENVCYFQKTENIESNDLQEKLQSALNSLDDTSRRLLISVYVDNEEAKDLAKKDGKAPQTYYNKLNLAKRKLALIMK